MEAKHCSTRLDLATKKARKGSKKPHRESVAMEEMAPPDDINHVPLAPPQTVVLPPGVYFNPGPEEMVCNYLNQHIAGDEMPDTKGIIFRDNVYGDSPDVLRQKHPPGNTHNSEHKWFFFSEYRFQSSCGKRGRRSVDTGGHWQVEQTKKELRVGGELVGFRHSFGFYLGKKNKTPWLMEEYTSCMDDGTGKAAAPVLCKIYFSPRASAEEKRKRACRSGIPGEEGVPIGHDGKKKTSRVMVPTAYFDAVAALLPPSSVRGIGEGQGAEAAPAGVLGHYHGQHAEPEPPPMGVLGHYLGPLADVAPPPMGVLGHYQGQFAADGPPPSSVLGLHHQGQFGEAAASDNFSMPIDEFLEEVPQLTYWDSQEAAASDNHTMPMDEFLSILEEAPPQLTYGDSQGAQGAVMGYPETTLRDYPACQELGPPQLDPKGDYEMDVDVACGAGARVEQEPEPAASPPLQESPCIDNGEQFTTYVNSKLDDGGDVGELRACSFPDMSLIGSPCELVDFDVSLFEEYLNDV